MKIIYLFEYEYYTPILLANDTASLSITLYNVPAISTPLNSTRFLFSKKKIRRYSIESIQKWQQSEKKKNPTATPSLIN